MRFTVFSTSYVGGSLFFAAYLSGKTGVAIVDLLDVVMFISLEGLMDAKQNLLGTRCNLTPGQLCFPFAMMKNNQRTLNSTLGFDMIKLIETLALQIQLI